jgi:hypothetical protein
MQRQEFGFSADTRVRIAQQLGSRAQERGRQSVPELNKGSNHFGFPKEQRQNEPRAQSLLNASLCRRVAGGGGKRSTGSQALPYEAG